MKFRLKKIFLLSILSLCFTKDIVAQGPAETIPAFKLYKLNKTLFTNNNLAPNRFLFFIFFDPNCEHCIKAIKSINENFASFKQTDLYLIVAIEDVPYEKAFLDKYGYNLLHKKNVVLLEDIQSEFINKFKPKKYPSIFLYSSKKKLLLYDDREEGINSIIQLVK